MYPDWKDRTGSFDIVDVRKARGNFLPGLLSRARKLNVGEGMCVVQTFEPLPLYSAMEEAGFDHYTEKVSDEEYRAYFYRKEILENTYEKTGDMPLKPTAMVNYKNIDNNLANISVNFWEQVWGKKEPAIDLKTKLILSLSNAVGAGRLRQATRELVKAYSIGLTVEEMDEMFSLFAWNGGIGTFSSEIGPSQLFEVYQTIKNMEGSGKNRVDITGILIEKFGEKNPSTGVINR